MHFACNSRLTDRTRGAICDQRVMLNGFYSARNYPEHLRRIRFKHPESGKTLVFLTYNTSDVDHYAALARSDVVASPQGRQLARKTCGWRIGSQSTATGVWNRT